jgi:hypothetical protein
MTKTNEEKPKQLEIHSAWQQVTDIVLHDSNGKPVKVVKAATSDKKPDVILQGFEFFVG